MPSIREIQDTIYDWVSIETISNPITGSVEVFSSSPFVLGTGTAFTQELIENTFVSIGGITVRIQSITDDNNLILSEDWPSSSQSGLQVLKGVEAIVQDQNFPRPNNQYITILISPLSRIGRAATLRPDGAGVATIVGNREFTVYLQCYGQDSIQILSDLRDSLEKRSVISFFCENEIANAEVLLLTDLSQLLDYQYEPRGALDLLFRTASVVTENVELIQEIEGEGQYIGSSDDPIIRKIEAP